MVIPIVPIPFLFIVSEDLDLLKTIARNLHIQASLLKVEDENLGPLDALALIIELGIACPCSSILRCN
jgi:hypothetical protein